MEWIWLLGFSAILHAEERMSPWLIAVKFRIPRPPSSFGAQIFFQAARQRGLELGSEFTPVHQKFLIIAVIFAKNFLEKIMLDM
jgi:hypothetical protein